MKLNSNQSIQPIITLKRYYYYILAVIILIIPINVAADSSMQIVATTKGYNWQKMIDKHFVVAFTEKDEKIARTTLSIVDNFHAQISLHIGDYASNGQ
ncbi:MAG: hypothetical protein AAB110_06890, partial [Candidatus Desantisbacteria bacterium]